MLSSVYETQPREKNWEIVGSQQTVRQNVFAV